MKLQPISNQTSEMSWACVTRRFERHVAIEEPFRRTWGAHIDALGKLRSADFAELVHPNVEGDRKLVAAWKRKLRTPGGSYLLFTSHHTSCFRLWPS